MAGHTVPPRGKDLTPFQNVSRSPVVAFMRKAVAQTGSRRLIAAFLPSALWGWISHYLRSRLGRRHKFLTYEGLPNENGVYMLGDESLVGGAPDPNGEIRVGLVGDWGTGTDEANGVSERMMKGHPHYTIHLGDVYYVGDEAEMNENCLGKSVSGGFKPCQWRIGSVGGFAMNGNHEMYALGKAYFKSFLPVLGMRPAVEAHPTGQKASYFCLQNDFWQIVALDTGYNSIGIPILEEGILQPDCRLRPENIRWLRDVVRPQDGRQGLIVLSHHQYYSGFEQMYKKPAEQLHDLIRRPVLWFWGHEHRMTIYGEGGIPTGIRAFGRCIGHGGMPVDITKQVVKGTNFPPVVYDHRPYQPSGEKITVGMNGFAMLTFRQQQLRVDYYDWKTQDPLLTEWWEVTDGRLQGKSIERRDRCLTVVGDLNRAIGN